MRAAFAVVAGALVCSSARADVLEPPWEWAAWTASRVEVPAAELSDREAELQAHCGASEAGLRAVARRLVERKVRGLPYLDIDGLTFAQRSLGEPHVWPRAWIVSGRALDHASTVQRLDAWRQSFHDVGQRRCGVATGYAPDGSQVVAAIALDAVADLAPVPVRVRSGAWVTVDATVSVPANGAEVVVMGPSGEPRTIPSSFDAGRVKARFAADRPGAFAIQVVADVATGPRPVLEAKLFADVEPPRTTPDLAAPGEDAGTGAPDKAAALARMVAAMRVFEGRPVFARSAKLDGVAAAHAMRMKQAQMIGHDVGDGDPADRVANAGIVAKQIGENVAHAPSVLLAHRALYASISHRENLLRSEFTNLGVAALDDADGSVWVAEVFSTAMRP